MKKIIPFLLGRYLNALSYVAPRKAGKTGFDLFCYPFRAPLKPFHHQFLATAEKSIFKYDTIDIQVYRWGNGKKKLLFLHGWQSHTYRWKNYIESFSTNDYTIYSLDAPGHGLSGGNFLNVPVYSAVVEHFLRQINDVEAIVSHSLGAFATLYTLYRLPLLSVRKLVLLAPPGEATEFIEFYKQTLKLNDRTLKHINAHFEDVIKERVDFFSAPKFASNIIQPGLIIHDEEDTETSHRHSIAINHAWKKSRLLITQGLGHNLKSPLVVNEVNSFVRERASEKATANAFFTNTQQIK